MTLPQSGSGLDSTLGDSQSVEVVHAMGPDAKAFLDGQLSQELNELNDGEGAWSLLLEPDGHLGALVAVVQVSSEHLVLLGSQQGDHALDASGICDRLGRFKIRVKVELSLGTASRVLGSGHLQLPERREGVVEHLELGGTAPVGSGDEVGSRAILDGIVLPECAPISLTPIGLGRRVIDTAVSFTKGCYTGQELVARMDSRAARPPRRLVRFSGEAVGISAQPALEGPEGVELIALAIDAASNRLGGFLSVPRSLEDLAHAVVRLEGHVVTLSEL